MKHFGDITKIDGHKVPIVDIITGGSPCQDLSVAGKRAGLDGERSGLFMEQIRIIKEMHDECRRTNQPIRPRYMVWENVPGAFSSNNGEDFRTVLEETARVIDRDTVIPRLADGQCWSNSGCILADGWSIAWRVHDAQFWGVPQRRKRISLVADFRGQSAPQILFEQQGLSRNTEPSQEARQGTPENIGRCTPTISFQERAGCDGGVKESSSNTSERVLSQPSITKPSSTVFGISPFDSNAMKSENPHSGIYEADTSRTLDLNGGNPACNQGGMIVIEGNGSRPSHKGDGFNEGETSYTLNSTEVHAVAFSQDAYDKYTETDQSATIKQSGGVYGGGQRVLGNTVNSLCAVDYKGAGNQYIEDRKVIINYGRDKE